MDYEKKLAEIEKLVEKLESSETTLNEGVKLFEEGVALTKECLEMLAQYKGKISSIEEEVNKLLADAE